MISEDKVEAVLQDAFEDVALLIGATAGVSGLSDDLMWRLLHRLDRVRLLLALAPGAFAHLRGPDD